MNTSPKSLLSEVPDVEAVLADFVAGLTLDGLAPAIVQKARLCLTDGIGASMTLVRSQEALHALASLGGARVDSRALVLGVPRRERAADAAFVNAIAAAATIRTDTHAPSASHPGMVVLPVVLALGEECGASASDLLCAIVAGYEVSIRLGLALVTPAVSRIFRPTGLTGAVGAAAAGARVLGLDTHATRAAMALAANTASGLNEWARAGTSEHVFHAGTAARNAIVAVELARAGAQAAPRSLSGLAGLLAAYGAIERAGVLTDQLGKRFHMLDVIHKLAPACIFAQAPCQAALKLALQDRITPEEIARVDIGVAGVAAVFPGCDFSGPFSNPAAAQQSIQFGVASVLCASAIDEIHWAQPRNLQVNELATRCHVTVDPGIDAGYPQRLGASISVRTINGETLRDSVPDATPMSMQAIEARFTNDARPLLGEEGATRLLEAIRTLGSRCSSQSLFEQLAERPLQGCTGIPAHSSIS
ncbi:MmgE/PrpD family protein [uncultured Caballeronia sp.]|uniref:MmgE/PrpD family protein n=1 Tax=uncultured Caballeronia sp. TaxID=1827198 RepID=UPI001575D244